MLTNATSLETEHDIRGLFSSGITCGEVSHEGRSVFPLASGKCRLDGLHF